MLRAWITGVTVAGVLGTAGAAVAGTSITHTDGGAAEAQAPAAAPSTTEYSSTSYRLGDAGTVTLTVGAGTITITGVTPTNGWTIASGVATGTHVEVSVTDGTQTLRFTADLVDGAAVVGLANTAPAVVPPPASATPAFPGTSGPAAPPAHVVVLTPSPTTHPATSETPTSRPKQTTPERTSPTDPTTGGHDD